MKKKEKKMRGGCLNCPGSPDLLPLDTVLYYGFGGYTVRKDGKDYWAGDPQGKWESFPSLTEFEKIARRVKGSWEVALDNPLRGAVWRRKGKDTWVLIETNQGFA